MLGNIPPLWWEIFNWNLKNFVIWGYQENLMVYWRTHHIVYKLQKTICGEKVNIKEKLKPVVGRKVLAEGVGAPEVIVEAWLFNLSMYILELYVNPAKYILLLVPSLTTQNCFISQEPSRTSHVCTIALEPKNNCYRSPTVDPNDTSVTSESKMSRKHWICSPRVLWPTHGLLENDDS